MIKKNWQQSLIYQNALENLGKTMAKQTEKDRNLLYQLIDDVREAGCTEINNYLDFKYIGYEELYLQPIIIKYINKFDNIGISLELIDSLALKGNDNLVPFLLDYLRREPIENRTEERLYKDSICSALMRIKSKKYIDEYVDVVNNIPYKEDVSQLIWLIGYCRREQDIPMLLELLKNKNYEVVSAAVFALYYYRGHRELVPYLEYVKENVYNENDPKWWRKHIDRTIKRLIWK